MVFTLPARACRRHRVCEQGGDVCTDVRCGVQFRPRSVRHYRRSFSPPSPQGQREYEHTRGNRSARRILSPIQEIDFSHDYCGVSADGSDCPFPHLNEAAAQRVGNAGCPHFAASFLGRPRRRGGEAAWAMVSAMPKEGPPRPSTHDSMSTRRYLTDRPALTGEGHPAGAGR